MCVEGRRGRGCRCKLLSLISPSDRLNGLLIVLASLSGGVVVVLHSTRMKKSRAKNNEDKSKGNSEGKNGQMCREPY